MKHVYVLATAVLSLLAIANGASAQTFTGGTYTAVRSGNWQTAGPNIWDPSGQPPAVCNNCLIVLDSGMITLNTSITLSGSSVLQVGISGSLGTQLIIPASGAASLATADNIILIYDGVNTGSVIKLLGNTSILDATASGEFDGVLSSNDGFLKLVGNAPGSFTAAGAMQFPNNALFGASKTGNAIIGSNATLPITLSFFDAVSEKTSVELTWTTAQEFNSDHFAIERSTDGGSHWNTLGKVAASGFSSLPVSYSYSDGTPAAGVNDYRLQSVDRDGKATFSPIKVVRTGLISSMSVFPNPATDYVNVSLSSNEAAGSVSVRILNQSGQVLAERRLENASGTTVSMPVGSYPQGNYLILVVGADGSKQVSKLFISRQ
jgi:hypothetical protein